MSKVADRLRKKRGSPVEIDGETFYVRALTLGEHRRLAEMPDHLRTPFLIGCVLCVDAGGDPELPKLASETYEQWAERIAEPVDDIPTDTIRALSEGVAALSKVPKPASILKNSDETPGSAS